MAPLSPWVPWVTELIPRATLPLSNIHYITPRAKPTIDLRARAHQSGPHHHPPSITQSAKPPIDLHAHTHRKTRGAAVLTPAVLAEAQQGLGAGLATSALADRLGIKRDTLSKAVRAGRLAVRSKKKTSSS